MNILVIGASGQLARSLVEEDSDNVVISSVGRPEIDLTKPETLKDVFSQKKPDIVVNASAYTAVDKAENEQEIAFMINATGVGHLASLCEQYLIPLIHVSTDYVYDGTKQTPYLESDPLAPLGIYGASKLKGEQKVAACCARHIILRTAWVYSPFGNNFVKTMLRLAENHKEISVVGDQIGSPTYAPHLARAIIKIAKQVVNEGKNSNFWGIYHASGSGEASWYEFANEIFKNSATYSAQAPTVKQITTSEYPTPAKRPANSRLDCTKLQKIFNIKLPDWREGTNECVKRLLG